MELQEIFDVAAHHLMSMNGPSLDGDACVYRGKDDDCEFNGQKCAVGLFIKDEHYDDGLEGSIVSSRGDDVSLALAKSMGQRLLTRGQLMLFSDLQEAHDNIHHTHTGRWPIEIVKALLAVASRHHLCFSQGGNDNGI